MSNDLISRKAVLDILFEARIRDTLLASPTFIETLIRRIKELPTAFDKEKVMRDLYEKYRFAEKVYQEDKKSSGDPYTGSKFIRDAYKNSIEIVEKRGIE